MNRWQKAALWTLVGVMLFGAAFVAGRKFLAGNESVNTNQIVLKKGDEKGQVVKGRMVKYDIVSFTMVTEGGSEMSFSDLANVSVWVAKDGGRGESPQKADWTKVAVGQNISLSMDKSGQKLISVIVYE